MRETVPYTFNEQSDKDIILVEVLRITKTRHVDFIKIL